MTATGASEARGRQASLLERAAKGEEIFITRYGRSIARLAPLRDVSREWRRQAIARLEQFSKGQTLGDLTIRELREVGAALSCRHRLAHAGLRADGSP